MYKVEHLTKERRIDDFSKKLQTLLNENSEQGWDLLSINGTYREGAIIIFKENPTYKLNKNINKGVSDVKERVNKVVEAIKGK